MTETIAMTRPLQPHVDPNGSPLAQTAMSAEPPCTSLSDVLALVEPQIDPVLLDAPGRAALHRAARRIPADLSPGWGLEVRLSDPEPKADMLLRITRRENGFPLLSGRHSGGGMADLADALEARSPFWRELRRFAGEWEDNDDWVQRLDNIWLEADTASARSDAALDAALDRPNLFWGPRLSTEGADRDLLAHLAALGNRFYGLGLDQAWVDAAAAAVPAEGLVFQMGVMGARDRPVMRLCTRNMDAEASLSWLARIGWPGDRTLLRRTVARLDPLCHDIALNVDILSDRVGPKLGVELYALSEADRRSLAMEPWRPLFDELLAQGLVRPDKVAALANYPSLRMFRQYRAFRRKPPVGYPALATNLHHLKLVFAGDRAVEVKAYIGVYRPVIDYNRVGKMEIDGGDGWF